MYTLKRRLYSSENDDRNEGAAGRAGRAIGSIAGAPTGSLVGMGVGGTTLGVAGGLAGTGYGVYNHYKGIAKNNQLYRNVKAAESALGSVTDPTLVTELESKLAKAREAAASAGVKGLRNKGIISKAGNLLKAGGKGLGLGLAGTITGVAAGSLIGGGIGGSKGSKVGGDIGEGAGRAISRIGKKEE